jgi:diadenosine tetraphosphatase ApaH/serine/threonine PP2A family protein phosphatase
VAAAEWAHEQLSSDDLDYLRRLPAERRIRVGDQLVLICHASPGSQTDGLPVDLDPSVTIQRIARTDARVIVCGHTHVAEWREFGRRLVCNPGSCGYAFDGDPGAAWALLTIEPGQPGEGAAAGSPNGEAADSAEGAEGAETDGAEAATAEGEAPSADLPTDVDLEAGDVGEPGAETDQPDEGEGQRQTAAAGQPVITVELRRTAYDPLPVSDEVTERGLPGDVYRAATIRTGRYVR